MVSFFAQSGDYLSTISVTPEERERAATALRQAKDAGLLQDFAFVTATNSEGKPL